MFVSEVRICVICGNSFERGKYATKAKYCSEPCHTVARDEQFQRYRDLHPKPRKPPVVKNCLGCGKDFILPAKGTGMGKYCSHCKPLIRAEQIRLWKNAKKRMKVWKAQSKKCKQCGAALKSTPGRLTHLRFCKDCSRERRRAYLRKHRSVRRTWCLQLGSNWRVHLPRKMIRTMGLLLSNDLVEFAVKKPPFHRGGRLAIIGEMTLTFLRESSGNTAARDMKFALPDEYMEAIGASPEDFVWLDIMNRPRRPSAVARVRLSIMSAEGQGSMVEEERKH